MSDPEQRPDLDDLVNSFNNPVFMNSPVARPLRLLAEYVEPADRFFRLNIKNTIVFFGSSRILSMAVALEKQEEARRKMESATGDQHPQLKNSHEAAKRMVALSRYYEDAQELCRKLTAWSKSSLRPAQRFYICSGGGPGIMEAANRGASEAGGRSIGLNITLPKEQAPNKYQSSELAFEFHYFFMRKFWFVYLAKALIVFPGGFGTMDEFFELLTIVQTEKTSKYMPIVLYGSDYWNEILDFDALVRWGMIDEDDLKLFHVFDDVDEVYNYLKRELTRLWVTEDGGKKGKRP